MQQSVGHGVETHPCGRRFDCGCDDDGIDENGDGLYLYLYPYPCLDGEKISLQTRENVNVSEDISCQSDSAALHPPGRVSSDCAHVDALGPRRWRTGFQIRDGGDGGSATGGETGTLTWTLISLLLLKVISIQVSIAPAALLDGLREWH